mmetsp:Transcript_33129/g.98564  ORF Transcript_33129/g.98564 Transcript_33129/m.98564 type:complete len:294 (+) Transcript_33129:853-1734(+)
MRCNSVRSHLRAGVEAVPAKPQQGTSQNSVWNVGRRRLLHRLPGAHEVRGSQSTKAGCHVDNGTTSEVMEVVLRDDEATAEQHVGHWAVHHQVPDGHEDKQGSEVHAVTDGTQQNGRRQDREHGLEREEDAVGDGAKQVVSHVVHEAERLRLANEVGVASSIAERQGEAKDGPQERDNSQRHQAHSDAANHVLVGDHAAVEEGNARNHDEHQGRARHHEGLVAAVRGCGRGRLVDDAVARRADAHGHRDADNCRQKQEDKRLLLPYCLVVEHRLAHRARSGEVAHGVRWLWKW